MTARARTPLLEDLRLVALGAAPLATVLLVTCFQKSFVSQGATQALSLQAPRALQAPGALQAPRALTDIPASASVAAVQSPAMPSAEAAVSALSPQAAAAENPTLVLAAHLAALSEHVVVGKVLRADAQAAGPNGEPGIHTRVEVQVTQRLKGSSGASIGFWVHGGRLGDRARRVSGQARYQVGEEVGIFLRRAPSGALWPTEMAQGKWAAEHVDTTLALRPATSELAAVGLAELQRELVGGS